jgi:thiazole synthase ThiGH ThiG subunit
MPAGFPRTVRAVDASEDTKQGVLYRLGHRYIVMPPNSAAHSDAREAFPLLSLSRQRAGGCGR